MSTETLSVTKIAEARAMIGLAMKRLGELNRDDESGIRIVLANAMEILKWRPIETAPKDGTLFLVWASSYEGLPAMYSLCAWQPDAGFCIDELRTPSHWMPLPEPPK